MSIVVISKKQILEQTDKHLSMGVLKSKQPRCATPPKFLKQMKISQPTMIDLSQKRFKGIALLYGQGFGSVLHPKEWERFGHFGTYILNELGDIYLVPMPYISIHSDTFDLQKHLYRLDSSTGKLSKYMSLDDIAPSAHNPYGLQAISYDCTDQTIWLSALDKSNYSEQKGRIYHIDLKSKKILQTIDNVDALSLKVAHAQNGKYLLVGSARDSALYAYSINSKGYIDSPLAKLLELSSSTEHIRKIKIKGQMIELQAISFGYTLIAETGKDDRIYYKAQWKNELQQWKLQRITSY